MNTVLNPATEETIAELPEASADDADRAVAAAKRAFPAWRDVKPADRARLMRRVAAVVEEHAEELALLETRNVGKPIADSRGEAQMVADVFHFYAGAIDKHFGQTIPVAGGRERRAGAQGRAGGRGRRPLDQLEHVRPRPDTLRRLQAVRLRP